MKKRGFYKNFFSIYILLVLQNVLTLSVNLTDNIMLGAYSEISLSGVTAVNQIQFIFQQMLSAFAEGAVILGSQYFGKKDYRSIKKTQCCNAFWDWNCLDFVWNCDLFSGPGNAYFYNRDHNCKGRLCVSFYHSIYVSVFCSYDDFAGYASYSTGSKNCLDVIDCYVSG